MTYYVAWLPSLTEKSISFGSIKGTFGPMVERGSIIGPLTFHHYEEKVLVNNEGKVLTEISMLDSKGLYLLSTNDTDPILSWLITKTVWGVFVENMCRNFSNPGFYNDSHYVTESGDGNALCSLIKVFLIISEYTSYQSERSGSRRIPFRTIRKEMADNQIVRINSLLYRRFMSSYGDHVNPGFRKACDRRMASSEEYMSMKVDVHGSIHNLYTSNLMRMLAELSMFVSLAVALLTVM